MRLLVLSLLALAACGSDDTQFQSGDGGDGGTSSGDSGAIFGDTGATDGGADASDGSCGPNLTGVVRDFSISGATWHPDFEHFLGDDRGIVATQLGNDFKPSTPTRPARRRRRRAKPISISGTATSPA